MPRMVRGRLVTVAWGLAAALFVSRLALGVAVDRIARDI